MITRESQPCKPRGRVLVERKPRIVVPVLLAVITMVVGKVSGQSCQNQLEINACKTLCRATQGTCGALCNVAGGACWLGCQAAFGVCDAGCAACFASCDAVCCPLPDFICNCNSCRSSCNSCRTSCNNARATCERGCRLDCDDCILNCDAGCESLCRSYRKAGEHCFPLVDLCANGLVCWPLPFPGEALPRCFPEEDDTLYPDAVCRSLYSPSVHQAAIDTGLALTFGTGSGVSAVVGLSQELGTVYGPDGRFGCYVSSCLGLGTNVEISTYACLGFFESYDVVPGRGISIVESAGALVSFVTSQALDLNGRLVGTTDCLSLGVSLLPISAGVYDCTAIVDTVGMRRASDGALIAVNNSPPLALCRDVSACANSATCSAFANVDDGSVDPDGDALQLTQNPSGPYALGRHRVELTVRDSHGEAHLCTGEVVVEDCGVAPPDLDGNGRVDLRDVAAIFNCFAGPDVVPPNQNCSEIRVDCDDDLDGGDFRHLLLHWVGP